jgi:O-antigen ligase
VLDLLLPRTAVEPESSSLSGVGSALIAAIMAASMVLNAAFVDTMTWARLFPLLVALLGLHCLLCPRLFFCREFAFYAVFLAYLFLSLLWTPDGPLAFNTLFPAADFLLLMILAGSLLTFHDVRAVMFGAFVGFWIGAAVYTLATGFPFAYPHGFSYNAVAAMYIFGLLVTLILGWASGSRAFTLFFALLLFGHIVATTSIKANLGIALGVTAAMLFYFRQSMRILRRNAAALLVLVAILAYLVISNENLLERIEAGAARIELGLQVLQARESMPGYSGFEMREYWLRQGLQGWSRNPLFGYGVEAFRAHFGITSHSTPVDLLYNTGIIGFLLFYGMFASLLWRMMRAHAAADRTVHALILGGVVCSVFISMSGTVFYQTFMAFLIAGGVALVRRYQA